MANLKGAISGAASGAAAGSAILPGVGTVVGGLLGALFGGSDRDLTPEEQAYINAQRELANLAPIDWEKTIPKLSTYKAIEIEEPVLQADYPELKTSLERQMPARNPREEQARIQALEAIKNQKGVQATELAKLQMQAAQAAKSQRDALLQAERARGTATGGQALAAQMAANQAAQNAAAMAGMEMAGQKLALRQDALAKYAQGLSELRGERVKEAQNLAEAKDVMKRYSEQLSENRKASNQKLLNEAIAARRAEQQAQQLSEIGAANETARARAGLQEKVRASKMADIDNQLRLASGQAGASRAADEADQAYKQGIFSGVTDLASGIGKSDTFKNLLSGPTVSKVSEAAPVSATTVPVAKQQVSPVTTINPTNPVQSYYLEKDKNKVKLY